MLCKNTLTLLHSSRDRQFSNIMVVPLSNMEYDVCKMMAEKKKKKENQKRKTNPHEMEYFQS